MRTARSLENNLEYRYEGLLWHQESAIIKVDPRLKRTDDNIAALNELKDNIKDVIVKIRKEFEDASKKEKDLDEE